MRAAHGAKGGQSKAQEIALESGLAGHAEQAAQSFYTGQGACSSHQVTTMVPTVSIVTAVHVEPAPRGREAELASGGWRGCVADQVEPGRGTRIVGVEIVQFACRQGGDCQDVHDRMNAGPQELTQNDVARQWQTSAVSARRMHAAQIYVHLVLCKRYDAIECMK